MIMNIDRSAGYVNIKNEAVLHIKTKAKDDGVLSPSFNYCLKRQQESWQPREVPASLSVAPNKWFKQFEVSLKDRNQVMEWLITELLLASSVLCRDWYLQQCRNTGKIPALCLE